MTGACITLELALKPEAAEEFLAQLPAIIADTRTRPGFVSIALHRHDEAPERVVLIEHWESADAYRAYLQWRMETGFMESLAAVLTEEPRIQIWGGPVFSVSGA